MPVIESRIFYNRVYGKTYSRQVLKARPFLNLGSGSIWKRNFWRTADRLYDGSTWREYQTHKKAKEVNIDHVFDYEQKVRLDIKDASLKIVYCSHSLEHTHNEYVMWALKESYRCLEKGGHIRLVVPDAELFIRASLEDDYSFFPWVDPNNTKDPIEIVAARSLTPIQFFIRDGVMTKNHIVQSMRKDPMAFITKAYKTGRRYKGATNGKHVNFFTIDKLADMLKKVGFSTVYRSAYLQSRCKFLREPVFDQTRPHQSLYVEAVK